MAKLTDRLPGPQRAMLAKLSDGALYNVFAWPLCIDRGDMRATWGAMWNSAMLVAKGLAEVREESETAMWISITPKGRAALQRAAAEGGEDCSDQPKKDPSP